MHAGRRASIGIANEEVADAAVARSAIDCLVTIDPHEGKMGVCEEGALIKQTAASGFQSTRPYRASSSNHAMARELYAITAEHKLPPVMHSGHAGVLRGTIAPIQKSRSSAPSGLGPRSSRAP